MLVNDLDFPEPVKEILKAEASVLNPPQQLAIKAGLLLRNSMVVAAPTASGKTLIAELAILKNFLTNRGKAVYIVPLKALASEKYGEFTEKYRKIGMKIAISIGDLDGSSPWLEGYDLIIVSNEKMDSLLRHGAKWIPSITLVVCDEIHMLNDAGRGPTLEVVLTRLRDMCNAQFLALSATIKNAEEISEWLGAKLVKSDYRPIKLYYGIAYPDESKYRIEYDERDSVSIENTDEPEILMSRDVLEKNKQALFFVSTRKSAEATAERIAAKIHHSISEEEKAKLRKISDEALNALSHPTKQCKRLASCLAKGTAFHHAGLVGGQRKIIEDNFRSGLIKILTATPTLCLDKSCKIWNGPKEISVNKAQNHNVLALKSKRLYETSIQEINSMPSDKQMIKIITTLGNEITVTRNHKMLVKSNGIEKEIKAQFCKPRQKIATVGRINLTRIEVPKWSDFVIENKLLFNYKELNEDIFYLIGAFLGDGYSGAEFKNRKIRYKGSPSIVGRDEEIFDKIKVTCKSLGIHYKARKNYYGVPQLVLTKSNWFREFLVRCGVDKGKGKYIHDKLLEADEKKVAMLLTGLFDTDGYVEKRGIVGISNISLDLINCVRRILLRFGIVAGFRKRYGSKIKILDKEYQTKESYELSIWHTECIKRFFENIGFLVDRKRESLEEIVNASNKQIVSISCQQCGYRINPNMFSGRTVDHKKWAAKKIKIIEYLAKNGEKSSSEIKNVLGFVPWKKEARLNSHFGFIDRKRIGNSVLWNLNSIGRWLYKQIKAGKDINWFFNHKECPLCRGHVKKINRENWRKFDFDGDIYWDIIKNVEETISSSDKVYDIVLPDDGSNDHLFVANGFIVHNSYGVNLPAWRVYIRDTKRYGGYGADYLPVLEVQQMSGRAGRPKYDTEGEAILVAKNDYDKDELKERYINGEPEPIYSKLSVEPVLRMHVLAIIASNAAQSKYELQEFFAKTFFAHQYEDMSEVMKKVEKILLELESYNFVKIEKEDFIMKDFIPAVSLDKDYKIKATRLGKRVSELYVDPWSAHHIISNLKPKTDFEYLSVINECLEMQPPLRVKQKELDDLEKEIERFGVTTPDVWDVDYESFAEIFKTSLMFNDWMNESTEDYLLEKYGIAPGELYNRVSNADWLFYAARELALIQAKRDIANKMNKLRLRIKHGVKEELLRLIKLRGIGRVRARLLWRNGIRSAPDIRRNTEKVEALLGKGVARQVLEEAK